MLRQWKCPLLVGVVRLKAQKPGADPGDLCHRGHHMGKTCQMMEVELRDGGRLMPDDELECWIKPHLNLSCPFLDTLRQYIPSFPLLKANLN